MELSNAKHLFALVDRKRQGQLLTAMVLWSDDDGVLIASYDDLGGISFQGQAALLAAVSELEERGVLTKSRGFGQPNRYVLGSGNGSAN